MVSTMQLRMLLHLFSKSTQTLGPILRFARSPSKLTKLASTMTCRRRPMNTLLSMTDRQELTVNSTPCSRLVHMEVSRPCQPLVQLTLLCTRSASPLSSLKMAELIFTPTIRVQTPTRTPYKPWIGHYNRMKHRMHLWSKLFWMQHRWAKIAMAEARIKDQRSVISMSMCKTKRPGAK